MKFDLNLFNSIVLILLFFTYAFIVDTLREILQFGFLLLAYIMVIKGNRIIALLESLQEVK
jgi:hypothetical protein